VTCANALVTADNRAFCGGCSAKFGKDSQLADRSVRIARDVAVTVATKGLYDLLRSAITSYFQH